MIKLFDRFSKRLKKIIDICMQEKRYEMAIAAMSAYSDLCYNWNQFYTDDEIENNIEIIADELWSSERNNKFESVKKRILFYDGFGLDTRGLALIYLKALISMNYEIIYVTNEESKGKQPEIAQTLSLNSSSIYYINSNSSHLTQLNELKNTFEIYKPEIAFFYTLPNDIAGAIVFCNYRDKVNRYFINLTDHAFWIGKKTFDYCIEFREYGASISVKYRNIEKNKLRILPFYPDINKNVLFEGFPFSAVGKKVLFSGGALYKTYSSDNRYYILLDNILTRYKDVIFVYAGEGHSAKLDKLKKKHKERMIQISERKDLYAFMKNIDVYINTYPISGGLMIQYAAAAGKVPLTLLSNNEGDFSGLLKNQENLKIYFLQEEEFLLELENLLYNDTYRNERSEQLKNACYTEQEFIEGLRQIINGKLQAPNLFSSIDTTEFRHEYKNSFGKKNCIKAIVTSKNYSLNRNFPILFAMKKLRNYIKRIIKKKG